MSSFQKTAKRHTNSVRGWSAGHHESRYFSGPGPAPDRRYPGHARKDVLKPGHNKERDNKRHPQLPVVVGAYDGTGRQVAFCRVISDKTRFAYLPDVIVAPDYRHQGIGQVMVKFAMAHPDLKDVYQWLLKTSDAHGLNGKCGFTQLVETEKWMGIVKPRPEWQDFEG